MRAKAIIATLLVATAAAAEPAPLPLAVTAQVPGLAAFSEARFRFLAWHVYDVALWVRGGRWTPDGAYALDIRYAIEISGKALAARSVEEMRALGYRDGAQLARWRGEMEALFPDIRPGERLVGVHLPGGEARFYGRHGHLGTVTDAQFARAFFAIWLDERTSEPGLRRRLLKLGD